MKTECAGEVKTTIEALFGNPGIAIDKFLRKMNWVYLFQNFPGLFPYMTYQGQFLDDPTADVRSLNDVREFPIYFGEFIIDFICGTDDDDDEVDVTNTGSSSANDRGNHSTNQSIFHNVTTKDLAKQGMRLFLLSRVINRAGIFDIFITKLLLF